MTSAPAVEGGGEWESCRDPLVFFCKSLPVMGDAFALLRNLRSNQCESLKLLGNSFEGKFIKAWCSTLECQQHAYRIPAPSNRVCRSVRIRKTQPLRVRSIWKGEARGTISAQPKISDRQIGSDQRNGSDCEGSTGCEFRTRGRPALPAHKSFSTCSPRSGWVEIFIDFAYGPESMGRSGRRRAQLGSNSVPVV